MNVPPPGRLPRWNLFSAARRLVASCLVLAALSVGLNAWLGRQSVEYTRKALRPDVAMGGLRTGCSKPDWSSPAPVLNEEIGHTVITYRVCFMTPNGQYIAYGDETYEMSRLPQLALGWHPTPEDLKIARQSAKDQRLDRAKDHFALLGWVAGVVILASLAIGWVVRGLLGIPYGHDHRPAPGDQ